LKLPVGCGGKREGRHQSYFRKELRRGAGRENIRKERGKDKAQNMGGRTDFGARGKVNKIKRNWRCRGKVKMNKCRTRRVRGETPDEGT